MDETESYFDAFAEYSQIPQKLPMFLEWNFKKILEAIPSAKGLSVLDIGTGNGILLIHLGKYNPSYRLRGIDFSQHMLTCAEANLQKEGMQASLAKAALPRIPLGDESIDIVVSNNAFHHIKDKRLLYAEIYRVLRKPGTLIYADSQDAPDQEFDEAKKFWLKKDKNFAIRYRQSADAFWQSLPETMRKHHPQEYHVPFKDIRAMLLGAGFSDIHITLSPSYFAIISAKKE